MPNLDQPPIGEIVMPHLGFREPRRRIRRVIDRDEAVVIRTRDIVDPCVARGHLMKRKVCARWERIVVSVDRAETKKPGRRASVALVLVPARFLLAGEAPAPGEPVLAEKHRDGFANFLPRSAGLSLVALQLAAHAVPVGRDRHDQLRAVVRHRRGTGAAREEHDEKEKTKRD